MKSSMGQILKKGQVKIAAPCRLDSGTAVAHFASPGQSGACAASARIAQTTAEGMIIEFTCSCGTKSYIQCDYAS